MGAGSIGSVVGGFLHLGGHQVYLLGKGPHIEAVMDKGLRISGIWGEHQVPDVDAGTSVQGMLSGGFRPQWALLTVKSYDTDAALRDMAPALPYIDGVISLQNGLGNLESVAKAAPGKAVGGRVIFGARTLEPGNVDVTVCADDVLLGPAQGGPDGVENVCDAFSRSGIPCRYQERILSYVWDKVLYNVCLNALATLLGTDYGHLGDEAETWVVMETLCSEFYAVASAEGVDLVSPAPTAYLERFRQDLLPPTRDHRSSMQEDIEHGRPTEINALNGAIWRLGRKHGIKTPASELLTRMIHFLEQAAL